MMNATLLQDMNIRLWRFRSLAPETRDPERMTAMTKDLVGVGVLTPNDGRKLASDIFNREFPQLSELWATQPIALTIKGIMPEVKEDDGPVQSEQTLEEAGPQNNDVEVDPPNTADDPGESGDPDETSVGKGEESHDIQEEDQPEG